MEGWQQTERYESPQPKQAITISPSTHTAKYNVYFRRKHINYTRRNRGLPSRLDTDVQIDNTSEQSAHNSFFTMQEESDALGSQSVEKLAVKTWLKQSQCNVWDWRLFCDSIAC